MCTVIDGCHIHTNSHARTDSDDDEFSTSNYEVWAGKHKRKYLSHSCGAFVKCKLALRSIQFFFLLPLKRSVCIRNAIHCGPYSCTRATRLPRDSHLNVLILEYGTCIPCVWDRNQRSHAPPHSIDPRRMRQLREQRNSITRCAHSARRRHKVCAI